MQDQDKAFAVLDAIDRGILAELPECDRWLAAAQTIQWAYKTSDGFMLTAAGRQALEEITRTRRPIN
ncbi:hypothetical protein [Caulobacter sp. S45]|uniref:hypothetical protein n=1 Tax=Caulobacter sp. S45 TaxID=1641861 RepID=UPI00131D0A80|nr:hypothetical protein [Caulobacter sp. S45]